MQKELAKKLIIIFFIALGINLLDIYLGGICFIADFMVNKSLSIMVVGLAIFIIGTGNYNNMLIDDEKENPSGFHKTERARLKQKCKGVYSALLIHVLLLIVLSHNDYSCVNDVTPEFAIDLQYLWFDPFTAASYARFIPTLPTMSFIFIIYTTYEVSMDVTFAPKVDKTKLKKKR